MECLNPDCTKRERLKKLFHGVEKAEDLPEFCPYCQARLHRTLDESRNENLDLSPKAFEGVSETTTDAFSKGKSMMKSFRDCFKWLFSLCLKAKVKRTAENCGKTQPANQNFLSTVTTVN